MSRPLFDTEKARRISLAIMDLLESEKASVAEGCAAASYVFTSVILNAPTVEMRVHVRRACIAAIRAAQPDPEDIHMGDKPPS